MATETASAGRLGLIELIDKELQVSMLGAAMRSERLGGTLLLFGPDGAGKSSLAFWLAAALNCERSGGRGEPCGECASCRKVAALNHPDVFWVFPVPGSFYSSGVLDEGKLADIFERKRREPWTEVRFQEKSEHHLAGVRRIRNEAGRGCFEGRRKVFVVTHADRLRLEAANAFLKLLEEPREDVSLLLCTERPSSLLPTILSRCQRMQVNRPGLAGLADLLESRFGMDADSARSLLQMADGRLSEALRLGDEGTVRDQEDWVSETLSAVLSSSRQACLELVEERKGPMFNRGDFERYVVLLTQAMRSALLECLGAKREEAGQYGSGELLSQFASRVAVSQDLIRLISRLGDLRDELNRNVNLRLLGWSLLMDMRKVIGNAA